MIINYKIMIMRFKSVFIYITIISLFYGCSDDAVETRTGSIVGVVNLFDESGKELLDKSNVEVKLENTKYSAVTSEYGKYEFENVPAGTYNIIFKKVDFAEFLYPKFQFVGGENAALMNELNIYKQSGIQFSNISLTAEGNVLTIEFDYSGSGSATFQVFVNDSSDVSCKNFKYYSGYWTFIPYNHDQQGHSYIYLSFGSNDSMFSTNKYFVVYTLNEHEVGMNPTSVTSYKRISDVFETKDIVK